MRDDFVKLLVGLFELVFLDLHPQLLRLESLVGNLFARFFEAVLFELALLLALLLNVCEPDFILQFSLDFRRKLTVSRSSSSIFAI